MDRGHVVSIELEIDYRVRSGDPLSRHQNVLQNVFLFAPPMPLWSTLRCLKNPTMTAASTEQCYACA